MTERLRRAQGPRGRIRRVLSAGSLLAALAVAGLGQCAFDVGSVGGWFRVLEPELAGWPRDTRILLGTGLSLLAVFLWLLGDRGRAEADDHGSAPAASAPPPPAPRGARAGRILLAAGVFAGLVGAALFAARGESVASDVLWAASVVLVVASRLPEGLRRGGEASPPFRAVHVALLLALLLAGFALRWARVERLPEDLHGDMAYWGNEARRYLLGEERAIVGVGDSAFPRLAFLPTVLSMAVFGNDLYGLRMTAVVSGVVILAFTYLIVWRLFDRHRPAALAVAVLATNATHVHFSRNPANLDPWLFGVPALFFLADGLKGRRGLSLAVAGVLAGLACQMYYSGRILVVLFGAALLHAALFRRRWITENREGLLAMAAAFVLTLGPNVVFFARRTDVFATRGQEVFLFSPHALTHSMSKFGVGTAGEVLLEHVRRSFLLFGCFNDTSTQFGYFQPMFSSAVAPLMVLGVAAALRRPRSAGPWWLLAWTLLVVTLGTVLTIDAPFYPRVVGVLSAAAGLVALALDRLGDAVGAPEGRPAGAVFTAIALLALGAAGWKEWTTWAGTVASNAHLEGRIGLFLYDLPRNTGACNLSHLEMGGADVTFLAFPRRVVTPGEPGTAALGECPAPPVAFVLDPGDRETLVRLKGLSRGGAVREHRSDGGLHLFTTYLVPSGSLPPQESGPEPPAARPPVP